MGNYTQEERNIIAKKLADERLEKVNQIHKVVEYRETFYVKYVKRFIDILFSLIALIVSLPINLIILVCTFFDVGRPIFFTQKRLGKDGKIFNIIKFRNMKNTKDENGELLPASQRVTKFGKFVRKTSLDELLNFWSILKGDMSLIGPRPLTPYFLDRYSNRHKQRMCVRPGLECPPWNPQIESWGWEERFENDIWYIEHVSFKVDCMMVVRLVQFALNKKQTAIRSSAQAGIFIGYDEEGHPINLEQLDDDFILKCLNKGNS